MQIVKYEDSYRSIWDNLIDNSRNGTFLLKRNYMDYHKDRFHDCSLMFFKKNECIGVFPACITEDRVVSHGGLTYGGLITSHNVKYTDTCIMLDNLRDFYIHDLNASVLIYKPIPYIYSNYPCEEDIYWLYKNGGNLVSRSLSSAIELNKSYNLSKLRIRQRNKALRNGISIVEATMESQWRNFWEILTDMLQERHQCQPVHSLNEMLSLKSHFPNEIKLYIAQKGREVYGGCILYLSTNTVHVQYIGSNLFGRTNGALDLLFCQLIEFDECRNRCYFDFGISTEAHGSWLNEGLLRQKEGFGARGVCYDEYQLKLK